jgi:GT2 family glycosyltransferase
LPIPGESGFSPKSLHRANLNWNRVLDQSLTDPPRLDPVTADTLNRLCDPVLDPLFLRPALVGVASTWYGHIPFAHWIVAACRPRLVVELGTHNGVSYAAFCEAVARYGIDARCYAVDTWQGDEHAGHYGDAVFEALRRFHDARYAGFSELLRCTFQEALPHFADGSIDLLHIDGFHTYDAVRGDFESWRPKLSPRAVVLFHDTNERRGDFGVWRLWRELQAAHPGFEFLHSHGLGVLAVGPDAPEDVLALCRLGDAASAVRERFALLGERWMDHFEQTQAIAAQQRAEARNAGYANEVAALQGARDAAAQAEAELARLTGQLAALDALGRESAETRAELEDAWAYQATLKNQLAQRDAHAAELLAMLAARAAEWERVHQVLAGKEAELGAARAALARAEALQAAIYRSASWRFAAPVRAVGRHAPWLGRGVRRALRLAGMALSGKLAAHRRLRAQRAAEAAALRASPLFDAEFYLASHPGLAASGHDPAAHFAWVGARSGAMPNRYFDTAWYLARNPAVAGSGENPLLHWQREGTARGLDPNPFLDVAWYLEQNPDAAGRDALTHWIGVGRAAGRDPNPMLDARALTLDHADGPEFDPLLHWWSRGARDGLNPHPLFDAAWYRAQHGLPPGTDPLAHWLEVGRAAGLPVSPYQAPGAPAPPAVAFSTEPAPDVSIIVPVYGHYADTLRCLQSVMLHSGDAVRYEVIVADDKPAGRIAPLLRERVPGLRIIENAANLGFLRSCNNAAGSALGRHIVFLNNDTAVRPDWLAPLARLADADPLVGLVGAKLLNPDGTVQEAGGAVLRNGWGLPYGAGRDPAAPEVNFVRDVDVTVGACILVRREAFEQAGGFDDRYAPAFYEEFDLAFALRDRGWRVVYQPASAVVHHGSNSYGAEARDRHSQANHAKFCVKWARTLLGQPLPNAPKLRIRSRPSPAGVALVIDDRVPEWDRNAGGVTLNQYLHLLQDMGYQVIFCPAFDGAPTQPYTATLQQDGIEVLHAPETLERWLRAHGRQIDLVWTARPDVTGPILDLIRAETRAPVLYYTHDLHHLRERRRWELEGDPRALAESKRLKRIETRIFAQADRVMTPSEEEAAAIRADVPEAQVHAIPPYLLPATPLVRPGPASERDALIFVGGYNHTPNVDAAAWLVRDIMPLVWAALPDVRLLLVGNAPPPAVENLASRRVAVTGFVPDVAPLYAMSRLSVNPLRYGAGVKGKIVASLQEGVPVVTTAVGNEGLGLVHGTEAWVAETAADLAAGIVALYRDPARCAAMAQAAQALLRRRFSEDAAWAALMGVLGQWSCRVCGRSASARPVPCPQCGADAGAQGLASAILQGLPSGQRRCIADAAPRLARLSVRACDDVPPPLASLLRRGASDDAPCGLLIGGAALDPAAALTALRPGARWVRPGRAEDAGPLIAAGFAVLAHDGDSPTLDARAPA